MVQLIGVNQIAQLIARQLTGSVNTTGWHEKGFLK